MTEEPIKRSTPQQRQAWNAFLKFVKDKGYSGSPDLDVRDRSLGLALLQEYNKSNPDKSITPDFIPIAQQEVNDIISGKFPGMDDETSSIMHYFLPEVLKKRKPSQPDNWFGSLTSKMTYPLYGEPGKEMDPDYERFIKSPAFSILKNVKKKN